MNLVKTAGEAVKVLRSENESILEKKNKLDGEYAESFDRIEECFVHSNISVRERGECMDETLDMLIDAQKNDIPVKSIIGTIERTFCQDMINSRGNIEIIYRLCKEFIKIPLFAFISVIAYIFMNFVNVPIRDGLYSDIAIVDVFVPSVFFTLLVNAIRLYMINKYGVYSEKVELCGIPLLLVQFLGTLAAYVVIEENFLIPSYATTVQRCFMAVVLSVAAALIVKVFVDLGGFEIVYRRKDEADIHRRNYELMLLGFARQYIKRNDKNQKKNIVPVTVKDYAGEIIGEIGVMKRILPVIEVVFVLEIYILGFLVLGIGARWYIIAAILILSIAVAVCASLMVTGNSRKDMLERIMDGQLDPQELIAFLKNNTNKKQQD